MKYGLPEEPNVDSDISEIYPETPTPAPDKDGRLPMTTPNPNSEGLERQIHSLTMRIRNAGAKAARDATIYGGQLPNIEKVTDRLKQENDAVDAKFLALITQARSEAVREFAEEMFKALETGDPDEDSTINNAIDHCLEQVGEGGK